MRCFQKIAGIILAVVCIRVGMSESAPAQSPAHADHRFSGAEHWAQVFDDPERDKWQKPHEVISALKLAPDATVADIGAGCARADALTPSGAAQGDKATIAAPAALIR